MKIINDTKLTDNQFLTVMGIHKGVKTAQEVECLKNIINYVYECAHENDKTETDVCSR